MEKKNIEQAQSCKTPSEQMEKVNGVINAKTNEELQGIVSSLFIITAKVTEFKKKNCCSPEYRDLVGSHIDDVLEKLEHCIDETMQAGNDVKYSAIITEVRDHSEAYMLEEAKD